MGITSIMGGIVTIAAAIPKIKESIDFFYSLWIDNKIKQVRDDFNLKENKQIALYKAIKNAKDDETRIALSIILTDINKL